MLLEDNSVKVLWSKSGIMKKLTFQFKNLIIGIVDVITVGVYSKNTNKRKGKGKGVQYFENRI